MQERESGSGERATQTARGSEEGGAGEAALGVLWVAPRELFHPLQHGAVIGRAEGCALRLDDHDVSRSHARIERDGSLWMLRDLASKNGSFVNAQRRELAPLSAQDSIRIGRWVGVVCRMPPEAVASGEFFGELAPGVSFGAATLATLSALPALAASDVPIILQGETGTGKELLARTIHELSRRSGKLVAINCSAVPEALAEAQLFGHTKGAFTGASASVDGCIVAAHRGSLLLDEVADLPLRIQAKLLRALEERAVTPIGSSKPVAADFRLLAASQEPLDRLVRSGAFRADLYARLNGSEIELPPLRQRREEVVRLLSRALRALLGSVPELDGHFSEKVCCHAWPYNVREVVQLARLLAVSGKRSFNASDLPSRFGAGAESVTPATGPRPATSHSRRELWLARHAAELGQLKAALQACDGNVTEAARQIDMPRHRARRLLEAESALARGIERRA